MCIILAYAENRSDFVLWTLLIIEISDLVFWILSSDKVVWNLVSEKLFETTNVNSDISNIL